MSFPLLIADEVNFDLVAKMIQENFAKRCANVQVAAEEVERMRFSFSIRKILRRKMIGNLIV